MTVVFAIPALGTATSIPESGSREVRNRDTNNCKPDTSGIFVLYESDLQEHRRGEKPRQHAEHFCLDLLEIALYCARVWAFWKYWLREV
jgi:hypothetical protein